MYEIKKKELEINSENKKKKARENFRIIKKYIKTKKQYDINCKYDEILLADIFLYLINIIDKIENNLMNRELLKLFLFHYYLYFANKKLNDVLFNQLPEIYTVLNQFICNISNDVNKLTSGNEYTFQYICTLKNIEYGEVFESNQLSEIYLEYSENMYNLLNISYIFGNQYIVLENKLLMMLQFKQSSVIKNDKQPIYKMLILKKHTTNYYYVDGESIWLMGGENNFFDSVVIFIEEVNDYHDDGKTYFSAIKKMSEVSTNTVIKNLNKILTQYVDDSIEEEKKLEHSHFQTKMKDVSIDNENQLQLLCFATIVKKYFVTSNKYLSGDDSDDSIDNFFNIEFFGCSVTFNLNEAGILEKILLPNKLESNIWEICTLIEKIYIDNKMGKQINTVNELFDVNFTSATNNLSINEKFKDVSNNNNSLSLAQKKLNLLCASSNKIATAGMAQKKETDETEEIY